VISTHSDSTHSERPRTGQTRWVRQQPRRAFRRTRRTLGRWLRAVMGPEAPVQHAELWQGPSRKTYLVPYETSWRSLAPGQAQPLADAPESDAA
jgi:hypothetical protein